MQTTIQNHFTLPLKGGAGRGATFRRFTRAGYAVFASLHREVRIGVLAVSMLASVHIPKVEAAQPAITDTDSTTVATDEELAEVTVAGTLSPLTALQSARIVGVITRQQIEAAAVQTVNDLLKLAVGVDVRQRGGFGIQTDISINGGTFDQITLLLNGVNITSPQTGHLAADFPVSLSDIERIEILEGAASRVYGASAFGGAINVVTKGGPLSAPDSPPALPVREGANTNERWYSFEAGLQGGSYGTVGGDAHVYFNKTYDSAGRPSLTGGVGGEALRSDGATPNSDFQRSNLFFSSCYDAHDFRIDAQAGYSQKSYGANTFYSAAYPNQYEQNRRLIMSLGAETKGRVRLRPEVYWQRLYDHFQLIRGTSMGENFHRTDVHGARVTTEVRWQAGRTVLGGEVREEDILSTSLGKSIEDKLNYKVPGEDVYYSKRDGRTSLSFNVEHTLLLPHFTISAGVLANKNTRFDTSLRFYPGIDFAYTPNPHLRLFASWDKGFRLPTFTDLYYKSPTHEGNQGMRAEESHSFQLGAKFKVESSSRYRSDHSSSAKFKVESSVKGFYHRGTNMIDWVMYSSDDVFHSANFDLDNMGFQAQSNFQLSALNFQLSYAFIHQRRHDATPVFKSNYAMEYLRHKLVATLDHPVVSRLTASWTLRWQDRMGCYLLYEDAHSTGRLVPYSPYATLDLKLRWNARRFELWVEATNLTNHRYYDLANIPQPGLIVLGGIRVRY